MIYSSNIFVVADPTTDNKPVLDRVSRLTNSACSYVHFFLSDYPDKEFIKKVRIYERCKKQNSSRRD